MAKRTRKKARNFNGLLSVFYIAVLVIIVALIAFVVSSVTSKEKPQTNKDGLSVVSETVSSVKSEPEFQETTATVLSTGDIMVHSTQLDGAKVSDGYDFSAFFAEAAPYFKKADLSIANLEITFGGSESGAFSGFPAFNTPDSLADVIKSSGLNLLITSNNHSYDTGLYGLKRTAQILKQKGIEFTGTKETADEPSYIVKEINNINIGIINYTYETTGANSGGKKYLNGMLLKEEANALVNSFNYNHLESFYTEAENRIGAMKNDGAEFIVFYIHWGNEYQLTPNTYQKAIAQKLSNMGVDMIIGSHPHVIQPVELIHSEDGQNTTVCVYSTGNAISNQRQELMDSCPSGHTEDGMLFEFTLRKTEQGVILDSLDLIPTWVNKYPGGSGYQYTIYPLENRNDGSAKYGLSSTAANKASRSYDRTKAIVAEGLTECQKAIGCDITFK